MKVLVVAAVFSLWVTLAGVPPTRAGVPGTFTYSEEARGVAARSSSLDITGGWSAVVQTHILQPGFRAPWHRHPDRSLVIMKRGRLHVWYSCSERQTWEAGHAYVNPPVETAVNDGPEPVELIVVYLNVPADQPAGTLPATLEPPPTGCPHPTAR